MDARPPLAQLTPPGASKHRLAGDDMQRTLEYASTPEFPVRAPNSDVESAPGGVEAGSELLETFEAVIHWDNPVLSGVLCLVGAVIAVAGDYLLKGKHGVPLLSALAYALLLDLALNFVRSILSLKWQEKSAWINSQMIKSIAAGAQSTVLQLAALHDRFLSARDPVLTLKVAGFLWTLTTLGYALSIWRLVCCTYFGAFGYGAVRTFCYDRLADAYSQFTDSVTVQWNRLGLKRSQSGTILAACLLVLMYVCSWATRLSALFFGLIIIRCHLKPNEVDAIATRANTTCAPYMHSAKKQARRLSVAASDFVRRTSMGGLSKAHRK